MGLVALHSAIPATVRNSHARFCRAFDLSGVRSGLRGNYPVEQFGRP